MNCPRLFAILTLFLPGIICGEEDTVVKIPAIQKPDYLASYLDPNFGSKVTRITGDPGTLIPNIDAKWDQVARHQYSKGAAWNCDQSLLYLGRHHGFPSKIFLDGTTYQPLFGRNKSPGTELRWCPVNPNRMLFVKDNAIGYWNPRKDTTKIIATFDGYADFHLGPWEGQISLDGKMVAITGIKDSERIAFAYDLATAKKYPDLSLKAHAVDWVSVSASGKHLILNGTITEGKGDQSQVYDLLGNKVGKLWHEYGRPSHYDLTLDADGEDIAVGVSKSKPDEGRVIKRRLKDGKITVLTSGGYASHTSTRNLQRPGWAYVTYQHKGPSWPPYWDEVMAVKLDGSQDTERIAHLHANQVDYLTESHAVPSPDGKRVLWASSWGEQSGRPISAFVAENAKATTQNDQ